MMTNKVSRNIYIMKLPHLGRTPDVGNHGVSNNFLLQKKEGNVLFNDALNTFYLRLYGVGHTVNDHSNSDGGKQQQ